MITKLMTTLACSVAALMSVDAVAEEYPHAFPRTGVTQLFDNERVTAWYVEWKRNIPQPLHKHRYDMAGVYLRYGPIRVTSPEGVVSPQSPPFEVPRPYFQSKGVTHREEVIGFDADAPERLAIMFDLKEVAAASVVPTSGMPAAFPREGAIKAIDNPRVTEWDHTWIIGHAVPTHMHDKDSVQVFFQGGTIKFTGVDGKVETKTFKFGDARFIPRGTVCAEEAINGSPRAVTIELK
ncbi:MAG: hypothetical protein H7Y02_04745 [Candidatus Obscuribacterales bacterium]|nr:hypothetical protein [Steroidobacteraceae bacterium]